MSAEPTRPEAIPTRRRWPGLVWALPLAALIIVVYLAVQSFAERGVDAVISFDTADGVKVGDTKVVYRGIDTGHVTKVVLSPDGKRVDVTVRLDPNVERALVASTTFWLIGAKPELTDIASLKAALAGVTIGMAPGVTGAPTRHFDGLDAPPIVVPGTPGSHFTLTGEQLGPIRVGSDVFYRGLDVGKVVSVAMAEGTRLGVGIFVQAPYDKLVHGDTSFWIATPVSVSLSGGSVSAQLFPAAALSGGVEFDTPRADTQEPPSLDGSRFVLYADKGESLSASQGPQVFYDIALDESAGNLAIGAPVDLGSYRIGSVKTVRLQLDAMTGVVDTRVVVAIEPRRLNLTGITPPADGNWQKIADGALNKLFGRHYRAGLSKSPPLIGTPFVEIDRVASAGPAALAYGGEHPRLPSRPAVDAGDVTDKLGAIVDKLNAIPLAEIGENVRQATGHLNKLLDSPEVADSVKHLDSTLDQLDHMIGEVRPQVGPLVANLNKAADQLQQTAASANRVLGGEGASQDAGLPDAIRQLTEAARSIRSLTDYLGRHPEAIIRGKPKEGP